ncbi:MAG: methylenetetrahydrofolate reductase [Minwuia sp.]|uniref:methylenetetrahydrofolate reductase n=1 Tax=Minwuia sp. TaxID=2493630 RepID=UPI003A852FE6
MDNVFRLGGSPRIGASIEATPTQILDKVDLTGLFPVNTRVYITDLGSDDNARMVASARKLWDHGYVAVPHLAARRFPSRDAFENRIRALAEEAGVNEALVIAGSPDRQMGPIGSSIELLQSGWFDRLGFSRIGVAGHPEGSPDIPTAALDLAIREKNAFAKQTDAELYLVTQFGFDADSFIAWAERITQAGNELPIHIGVSGPAKIMTLLKYAAACGVGESLNFLKKRASAVTALATGHSPEAIVGPLEAYWALNPGGAIRQMHVFPFGGLKKTSEWLHQRGSWVSGVEATADTQPIRVTARY